MKIATSSGRLVYQLRKIILKKSHAQFAAMIGVSKDTIISVEHGRIRKLTKNLAKRIEIATGANLLGGKLESPFKQADYTPDDFEQWRKDYGQTNKATAIKKFDEMKTWLKMVFLAAAKSGRAGNRDRLPAVCLSLAEWLNKVRVQFKLEDEIEDILDEETRFLMARAHTISSLLENPNRSKKELAKHGIDFNKLKKMLKKHAADGFLFIQDEYRDVWTPGRHFFSVLTEPRTLIPEARYWIKEFKADFSAMLETGWSHPDLRNYVKKVNEDLPFAELESARNSLKS